MIAKLPGCGGDDIIDTFDFRKPDFAASSFYSCTARVKKGCVSTLVSKSGHCGLFVKEFENKGSVHWLRQDDKESGEEFLKRAYQQLLMKGLQVSPSRPLVRWAFVGWLEWLQARSGSVVFDVEL